MPPSRSLPAWRDRRVRAVSIVLAVWTVLWAGAVAWQGMYSWHYFVTGARVLGSPDAVHVFAAHPELQMGPLTLVVALGLVSWGGAVATVVAGAGMLLVGVLVLVMVLLLRPVGSGTERAQRLLVVGLLLAPAWTVLAVHYGHLDDVLALAATAGAMLAMSRSRPGLAAVVLAVAVGFKPWAAPCAVVLLASPRAARHLGLFAVLVLAPWAIFLVGDPSTLHIGSFAIAVAPDSALRALGLAASTTPVWDRPLQLLVSVALGAWAVRRGHLYAVPFVVLATRMLLDPGTYPYYTTGLLVAALVLDLRGHGHRLVPRYTLGVSVWLGATAALNAMALPAAAGYLRAAYLLAVLTTATLSGSAPRRPSTPRTSVALREPG
ncbi:MAG: hypothetical protein ABI083_02400 [Lapillicoccus sp.]